MPVFPGTEQPIIKRTNTIEKDGFQEALISMYSHTGTHMDAPAHMLENSPYLDNFDIDKFIGQATILDFSAKENNFVTIEMLKTFEDKIRQVDFIILKFGWGKYWGKDKYFEPFPSLSEAAANWLTNFNLKGIGIDTISIDDINSATFPIHKILLPKNILIIENLTNLDSIESEFFMFCTLPLKTKDADGAPVRAIAIENF